MDARGSGTELTAQLVARALLLAIGLALAANAIWLVVTANLNLGTVLVGLAALGLIAWAVWYRQLPLPRLFSTVAVALFVAVLAMSAFLATHGTDDNAGGDEDAVIVLGAAVHGSELSRTLIRRLDTAAAYHERNPQALIVVSGGQGPQEDLPEAVAMRQYLIGRGIPSELIVVEDRSTSTEENFAFSKARLDRRLPSGYRVVFVTDEFHVYRAGQIASAAGLTVSHVSSRTPWYFWPANYLRETVAVVTFWLTPKAGK